LHANAWCEKFRVWIKTSLENGDRIGKETERSTLKKELAGKFVSLKMDAYPKIRVMHFATDVRYFGENGTVKTKVFTYRYVKQIRKYFLQKVV